ncbi:hypothetical protein KK062_12090 [Fulvivirgaceae bacterium PWU5]|uniref:Uncharacterized protein n=1 Tax=Dawidia cretensis TaxID=2782350 RepID=A0AAP2GPU1_9BACT|nr:hypothetical protein [Dawidia cretensis]MBT1708971.1 hypothetical protein [Dawidia cretensis]
MNYIVYLSHSSKDIYYEALYSIYSLAIRQDLRDVSFIIYTDDSTAFQKYLGHLQVHYETMTPEIMREWRGKHNFVHRAKVRTLQDVLTKYTGNFLFLDSDTYAQQNLAPIFNRIQAGELFMDRMEKHLDRSKIYKPLLNHTATIDGVPVTFTEEVEIWNTGAVGYTNAAAPLLEKSLALTDQLLDYYIRHIIEQFAISYTFQRDRRLNPLDAYVFHYWNVKEFRGYLRQIFEHPAAEDRQSLETIVRKIDPSVLLKQKLDWKYNGGIVRAIERMFGKKFALTPLKIEELLGA